MNKLIDQANRSLANIQYASRSSADTFTEAFKSLREIIDEHEKAVLQQISDTEESQKKTMVDYRGRMQGELETLNQQIADFTMIVKAKSPTKLMQAEQRFDEFIKGADGQLKKLALPTIAEHHLEGLDKLSVVKEEILKFGQYVKPSDKRNGKWPVFYFSMNKGQNSRVLLIDITHRARVGFSGGDVSQTFKLRLTQHFLSIKVGSIEKCTTRNMFSWDIMKDPGAWDYGAAHGCFLRCESYITVEVIHLDTEWDGYSFSTKIDVFSVYYFVIPRKLRKETDEETSETDFDVAF